MAKHEFRESAAGGTPGTLCSSAGLPVREQAVREKAAELHAVLQDPRNLHLLSYLSEDAFGAHLFPGDIRDYPQSRCLADLQQELSAGRPLHLSATIPLCRCRCRFCQFPVITTGRSETAAGKLAAEWVDAVIAEARLWLSFVPALRTAPVGEFNLFGGTPTQLPIETLARLIDFFRTSFNFTAASSIRIEGTPESLDEEKLRALRRAGCSKISIGVQSLDDRLLAAAGRTHTAAQAIAAGRRACDAGFARVSADLIYGLPGQSVQSFLHDVQRLIAEGFSCIVITKLHLRDFAQSGTAVSGTAAASWQSAAVRAAVAADGFQWPTIAEQCRMREEGAALLEEAGYREAPYMYFSAPGAGPELWKMLVVGQGIAGVEIGLGLGATCGCSRSETQTAVDPQQYLAAIRAERLPIEHTRGFSERGRVLRAVKSALTSCRPLRDDVHQLYFPEDSLFRHPWRPLFQSLERRRLVSIHAPQRKISLTAAGRAVVEAIINTEFDGIVSGERYA